MKQASSRFENDTSQARQPRDTLGISTTTATSEHISTDLGRKISATLKLQNRLEIVCEAERSAKTAPLILIHDGSGICLPYYRIRPFGRTIYAIHDLKFQEPDSWSGIPAMARAYANLIEKENLGAGPLLLGGWSFGGVVAFEAARVLQEDGHAVVGVVLIDSPPPLNHKPLSAAIIDAVSKGGGKAGLVGDTIRRLVKNSFFSCASMLEAFKPEVATNTNQPAMKVFLLRSIDGFFLNSDIDSGKFDNPWLQDRSDPRTSIEGWEIVTGTKVPYADIPGNHFQVFDIANVSLPAFPVRES